MKGLNKQLGTLIAGSALLYALIPFSPAVSSSVKDTSKSFSNISLADSQKQLAKSTKSQVPTQLQGKSNKQASVTKSVQASVVQIRVGCIAKVYWADNRKTYYVSAGGSGSGFFVDSNGYIITNAHVTDFVENSDKCLKSLFENFVIQLAENYNLKLNELDVNDIKQIGERSQPKDFQLIQQVLLPNGRQLPFKMIVSGVSGTAKDVAIIKTDMKNAPILKLSDYNDVNILDQVIVAGYPGLPDGIDNPKYPIPSFTDGKVSAKKYFNGAPVLQISAPVTHGNSGGPVVNDKGEVIGIVAFGSDAAGFNFAVPSNTIMKFIQQAGIFNGEQVVILSSINNEKTTTPIHITESNRLITQSTHTFRASSFWRRRKIRHVSRVVAPIGGNTGIAPNLLY